MTIIGCHVCEDVPIRNNEDMVQHLTTDRHKLNAMLHHVNTVENTEAGKNVAISARPRAAQPLPKKKSKRRKGRYTFYIKLGDQLIVDLFVENTDKTNPLLLTEVSRLFPCPQIAISDAENICGSSMGPGSNVVVIAPKSSYVVTVSADCNTYGLQACPIHFRLKRKNEDLEFSILRELNVVVSCGGKTIEENETDKVKSPYQCDKWPLMKTTVKKRAGRPICLIPTPQELKRLLAFNMKPSTKFSVEDSMTYDKLQHRYKVEKLTRSNYVEFFRDLMYMEIYGETALTDRYNMTDASFTFQGKLTKIVLEVPGLDQNRPSVVLKDGVFVCVMNNGVWENTQYEGEVVKVLKKSVHLDYFDDALIERLDKSVVDKNPLKICVRFVPSHYCTKVRISAVEAVREMPHLFDILFPRKERVESGHQWFPLLPSNQLKNVKFINQNIKDNMEQASAIVNILAGTSIPAPYVIIGPPGTGKTDCVVEAIMQVMLHYPGSRILVCAPSNSACDHVARSLFLHINANKSNPAIQKIKAVRFYAMSRTNLPTDIPVEKDLYAKDMAGINVTISTLINAVRLARNGAKYSHVFIDEAGQALEPEALTGFMSVHSGGQVVLAGDPHQLGPICMSVPAHDLGLRTSFLERLTTTVPLYQKLNGTTYDSKYVTMLKDCYRCHPRIIELSNRLFYNSELRCKNLSDPLSDYCFNSGSLVGGSSLIVQKVVGKELTHGMSPSFYNEVEVKEVMAYLSKMLDPAFPIAVKPNEIGIISPYARQVAVIRSQLKKRGWEEIAVGTVELFQGQERRVTIVSTVRSQVDTLLKDIKLGFVKYKGRFNVMMTRASAKNIIVGNTDVLETEAIWKELIMDAKNNGYYTEEPLLEMANGTASPKTD